VVVAVEPKPLWRVAVELPSIRQLLVGQQHGMGHLVWKDRYWQVGQCLRIQSTWPYNRLFGNLPALAVKWGATYRKSRFAGTTAACPNRESYTVPGGPETGLLLSLSITRDSLTPN
jgi:hypothetical protein